MGKKYVSHHSTLIGSSVQIGFITCENIGSLDCCTATGEHYTRLDIARKAACHTWPFVSMDQVGVAAVGLL